MVNCGRAAGGEQESRQVAGQKLSTEGLIIKIKIIDDDI
jgi:hypothetical protein